MEIQRRYVLFLFYSIFCVHSNKYSGDSFSAGDVLLEIETDKAQIDVEAADDGVVAKIYEQNGAKEIPVGKTIAVIAEPGDDVANLELPKPEAGGVAGQSPAPKEEPKPVKKEEQKTAELETKTSPSKASISGGQAADTKQTLLPSVSGLLSANGISKEDAFKNIKATGPNGRLLKGDILVYLGKASGESLEKLEKEISKNSKLDLSNIEIKSSTEAAPSKVSKDTKNAAVSESSPAAPAKPEPVILKQDFSLGDLELLQSTVAGTLGSSIELSRLVEKASKAAYRDIKEFTKPKRSSLYDPLFESIVAPRSSGKPFEISFEYPQQTIRRSNKKTSDDIFTLLSSSKGYSTPVSPRVELSDLLKVTLRVNDKAPGAIKKAEIYLDRLNFYLGEGKGDLLL